MPGVICLPSKAPDHPQLTVHRRPGIIKDRKASIISTMHNGADFRVFKNTIDAAECAVKERVFWHKIGEVYEPTLKPSVCIANRLRPFRALLKRYSSKTTPMQPRQFADAYQGRRRNAYHRACDDLERKPFKSKDAVVKAFLKYEKYNFKYGGKRVVPRVISPRGPRYTVSLGIYVRPLEKRLFGLINQHCFKTPAIMKGLNAKERGSLIESKWSKFSRPVAIGLDATRFDRHVSREMLEFEHSVYQMFYEGDGVLSHLLRLQLKNFITMNLPDGFLKYKTDGTRMSGDMNTALGNCLISVAILYCFAKHYGVNMEICNDGDDSVIIMETHDLPIVTRHLNQWFNDVGFLIEVEDPVYVMEHIVFCQCQPIKTPTGYIMVRDPRASLTKDAIPLIDTSNPQVFKGWMNAVGQCGLSLTGGIPVLQSYYLSYIRNGKGGKILASECIEGGFSMLSRGMNRKAHRVEDTTRFSFWLAFGVCPDEQIAIEEYYDKILVSPDESRFEHNIPALLPIPHV